jgi:hypothetical protein
VSNPSASTRTLYRTTVSEQTTLAVIQFMTSRFGLKSNALIVKFGTRNREAAGV